MSANLPLVMDLDGTLIKSDTTHELLVLCARWFPLLLPIALVRLLISRPAGKRWLVQKVGEHIDPEFLPYDENAKALMDHHRSAGGAVWLVSGSDHLLVDKIAKHVGVFDRWQGTDQTINLTSSRKARFLLDESPDGFMYAGNSKQDIAVWREAERGFGFRAPSRAYNLKRKDKSPVPVEKVVEKPSGIGPIRKAMRLHQWAKNVLIFIVPFLLMQSLVANDYRNLIQAFICFGMMASGTYILNDLFDIPDDRKHATKKDRPLASGILSVPLAIMLMGVLIVGSMVWSWFISQSFAIILGVYAFTTIVYSFRLKRLPIVDVFILSFLFSLRVFAGAVVIQAPPTAWLMVFIGLTFLSLALAKRYVEVAKSEGKKKVSGRGYQADDAPMLMAFGAATAYTSVLALVIYGLLAPQPLLSNAFSIALLAAIIAGWFMRIWLVAGRGQLNDDPVLFAVKDHISFVCLFGAAAVIAYEKLPMMWMP